jgi:hypothetical protein
MPSVYCIVKDTKTMEYYRCTYEGPKIALPTQLPEGGCSDMAETYHNPSSLTEEIRKARSIFT